MQNGTILRRRNPLLRCNAASSSAPAASPAAVPGSGNTGLTPLAMLGSDTFEVEEIDVTTLAFGPDGAPPVFDLTNRWVFFFSHRDVNHDGIRDLVAFYRTSETGIEFGDTQACVTGELRDGTPFEGCDDILTVPGCGLGFELVFLLPPLMWAHGRRRWWVQ